MIALAGFAVRSLLRGRASIAAVVVFSVATGLVTLLGLGSFRQVGLGAVGPAAAALVNLAYLLPTAQAIVLGALAYSGDREGGFLAMLRARGMSLPALVGSAWLAVTASAWLSLLAGFGTAAVLIAGNVTVGDLITFGMLLGVMLLVAAAAAAIGVLVGVLARTRLQAALGSVAAWFVLAIALDLAAIGTGIFLRLGEPAILGAIVLDPLTSGRIAALLVLDPAGDAVGSLGAYLVSRLGGPGAVLGLVAVVLAWTVGSLGLAAWVQRRRDL